MPGSEGQAVEPIQQVAVAVVEHEDRFLVGLRGDSQTLSGLAEFPGGRIKPGETPDLAAVRECREETGLDVRVIGRHADLRYDYPHGRIHLHFLACRLVSRDAEPLPPFRWIERDALARCDFPPANAALVERLAHPS